MPNSGKYMIGEEAELRGADGGADGGVDGGADGDG